MNPDPEKARQSPRATVFFIACFALITYFLYLIFLPFFSTLIWVCLLVVVFQPFFQAILTRMRGRRSAAALITCLAILLLIVLPLTAIGILLTQQSVALYHTLQENMGTMGGEASAGLLELQNRPLVRWVLSHTAQWFGNDAMDMEGSIKQALSAMTNFILTKGPSLLAGVGGILYQSVMMFITMFFLFRDGPAIMDFARASSPLPEAYHTAIVTKFRDVSFAAFFGSILTAMVQGFAGGLLFWAVGMSSPLFWGAAIAFVSLVPIIGAFLVWGPVSAYFFLIGSTAKGIVVLALGGIIVSSIDNVLKPMIIRGRTDMHPMLVFLSVLGGVQAFGFLGVLLGPFFVAIFLSFMNFYRLEFRDTYHQEAASKK